MPPTSNLWIDCGSLPMAKAKSFKVSPFSLRMALTFSPKAFKRSFCALLAGYTSVCGDDHPPIWKMINDAIVALNGKASYSEIKEYISQHWANVNSNSISAQIIVLTVNQPSRIHYPENKQPRQTTSQYDVLFTTGRGQVVKYDPNEHGLWEIFKNDFGGLEIKQIVDFPDELDEDNLNQSETFIFPVEANLRDFLIKNLHTIKNNKLSLYVDENGREGKEYPIEGLGYIDILTIDKQNNFVVFELKLTKGPDRAIGQILRYMGWVKKNLAKDKQVKGIIVANKMDEKIRYAVSMVPGIELYEYEMKFELKAVID